jgi:hypothetical protein
MGFLAPSILLGLVAAGLPWLIHLIGKRRATPVRFAAMQLLYRSERRVAARRRLREILLLIARTAIAAALPLVFARPFTLRASDLPEDSLRAQSAVIVLDDSVSMRRQADGAPLFERARDRVRTLLRQLPGEAEVGLVLASEGSEPKVGELSLDRPRLLEALEGSRASARAADYPQALRRATTILAASTKVERRIFVVTDLQAAGWGDEPLALGADAPDVALLDVGEAYPFTNRAVLSVTATPATELGTGSVAVEAEVADFTGKASAALPVILKIDDQVVSKSFIALPASGRAKKKIFHVLPSGAGSHDVEVSIEADDFPVDDRRLGRLELSRALRVLIINGDARTVHREDEAYFLETALKTSDRTTSVVTALPDDVSPTGLGSYNVVFVANVAEPSAPLSAALARFVNAGGGLFLSVGGRVNTQIWNERLGPLLPQPVSLTRTAAALPGQAAGETVDDRPAARLAPLDRRHPLLASFPARGEGLASARFFKFVLLEPVPDTAGASVILRYESGAPALVEKQVGKGRVMLLSTTVDREWTDLPIRSGFLPLIQESARRLAGTSEHGGTSVLLVGQRRDIALGPYERRLEITKPDGTVWVASPAGPRPGGARVATFTETDEPGSYRVRAAGPDGVLAPRAADGFVVNIDPRESDPARLTPERRPDRKAAPAPGGKQAPKRRVELWHGLAAVLILLVLAESLLTLRWRRPVVAEQR